jgi:hypothetical protein
MALVLTCTYFRYGSIMSHVVEKATLLTRLLKDSSSQCYPGKG